MEIGIIGCGAITESFYTPALNKLSGAIDEIILVDPNEVRREQIMNKLAISTRGYNSYVDIESDVDGVIISSPPQFHFEQLKYFIDNKINVLCEKPLVETRKECESIEQLIKENNTNILVNNTRRLFPSSKLVKQLIEQGEIGDIEKIIYYEGGEFTWPSSTGFYFNNQSGRGVLMDRGPHIIDLLLWWAKSNSNKVESFHDDSHGGPESLCEMKILFEKATAYIKINWLNKLSNQYCVEGTKGKIYGDIYNWQCISLYKYGVGDKTINIKTNVDSFNIFAEILLDNFISVIRNTAKPLVAGLEVIESIKLIDDAYKKRKTFNMPWDEGTTGV